MTLKKFAKTLADSLTLTRPLVCLDLETTGTMPEKDRIVQIATAKILPDGAVSPWASLVNPEMPIPIKATEIHGKTDAMVADAPTFTKVAPAIRSILSGSDLAGFSIKQFDQRLLAAEFRRAQLDDPTDGAMILDAKAIFFKKEPRTLVAAVGFYGIENELVNRQAHDASSDVEATVGVLAAQLQRYPDLPRTVKGLHDYTREPDWIDSDGKFRWENGIPTIGFGTHKGTSLADLAASEPGYLEWILKKNFSGEVKTIARDALGGKLPIRGEQ